MFRWEEIQNTICGISVLASEAIRELMRVGWVLDFSSDSGVVAQHDRLVRPLIYTDNLGSLVDRDQYNALLEIGQCRMRNAHR